MKKLQRLSLYEVEGICDGKVEEDGRRLYLVKWKDWEEKFNTWQPIANLITVKALVLDFESQRGNLEDPFKEEAGRKKRRGSNSAEEKPKQKKQVQSGKQVQAQKAKEAKQAVPNGQVVKRKRGRPRKIPLEGESVKVKSKFVRKEVAAQNESHQQPSQDIDKFDQVLHQSGQSRPAHNYTDNAPKIESLKKRKPISKRTRTIQPSSSTAILKKEIPSKKEELQAEEKQSSYGEDQQVQGQRDDEDEEVEEESGGIEQVLLKGKNYTDVRVTFKEDTFFYEIPYEEDGQPASIILTTSEINKVNPLWMQGFYQGFYL